MTTLEQSNDIIKVPDNLSILNKEEENDVVIPSIISTTTESRLDFIAQEKPKRLKKRGKQYQYNSDSDDEQTFSNAVDEMNEKKNKLLDAYMKNKARLEQRSEKIVTNKVRRRVSPRYSINYKDIIKILTSKGPDTVEFSRDRLAIFILYSSGMRAGHLKNVSVDSLQKLRNNQSFIYDTIKPKNSLNNKQVVFPVTPAFYPFIKAMEKDFNRVLEHDGGPNPFPLGPFGINRTTLQMRLNHYLKRVIVGKIVSTHSICKGVSEEILATSGFDVFLNFNNDKLSSEELISMQEKRIHFWEKIIKDGKDQIDQIAPLVDRIRGTLKRLYQINLYRFISPFIAASIMAILLLIVPVQSSLAISSITSNSDAYESELFKIKMDELYWKKDGRADAYQRASETLDPKERSKALSEFELSEHSTFPLAELYFRKRILLLF